MVRVVRLERTVSWSQTRRDTNFAIPGYSLFCHDTTARGKNKDFSVCGHLCGQSRFYTAFGNRGKSHKRRCCKALRRFAMPCPGYRHGTPKPPALPTAPHPVVLCFLVCFLLIDFLLSIRGASLRNIVAVLRLKRSLRSLFLHLGAMPSSATGGGIPPRPTAPHPVVLCFLVCFLLIDFLLSIRALPSET